MRYTIRSLALLPTVILASLLAAPSPGQQSSAPETPHGQFVGSAANLAMIVLGGEPTLLTATGRDRRRALTLILHQTAAPLTTLAHDWTPKGLCKN